MMGLMSHMWAHVYLSFPCWCHLGHHDRALQTCWCLDGVASLRDRNETNFEPQCWLNIFNVKNSIKYSYFWQKFCIESLAQLPYIPGVLPQKCFHQLRPSLHWWSSRMLSLLSLQWELSWVLQSKMKWTRILWASVNSSWKERFTTKELGLLGALMM